MAKWEYRFFDSSVLPETKHGVFKVQEISTAEAEAFLNGLGSDGWEVISMSIDFENNRTGAFVGVAKREKV